MSIETDDDFDLLRVSLAELTGRHHNEVVETELETYFDDAVCDQCGHRESSVTYSSRLCMSLCEECVEVIEQAWGG